MNTIWHGTEQQFNTLLENEEKFTKLVPEIGHRQYINNVYSTNSRYGDHKVLYVALVDHMYEDHEGDWDSDEEGVAQYEVSMLYVDSSDNTIMVIDGTDGTDMSNSLGTWNYPERIPEEIKDWYNNYLMGDICEGCNLHVDDCETCVSNDTEKYLQDKELHIFNSCNINELLDYFYNINSEIRGNCKEYIYNSDLLGFNEYLYSNVSELSQLYLLNQNQLMYTTNIDTLSNYLIHMYKDGYTL